MRWRHRALAVAAGLAVVALLVGAVFVWQILIAQPSVVSTSPNPVSSPPTGAVTAMEMLDTLPLVDGSSPARYERDRFGQRWADVDGNGCDTRNDILARDLRDPVFRDGTGGCAVARGELVDPYDGHVECFVSGEQTSPLVQIDHLVALAWAWRHGAAAWSDDQRLRFANDPANLVATADQINEAKSDSGPAQWLPPAEGARCGFVIAWVDVLARYELAINAEDRRAAQAVLDGC